MREKWIDNAKGIAMILVILGHAGSSLQGSFNFQFVFGFHLVMFFLLSGYTTRKKKLNGEYISQKFKRLMVPYFLTCLAVTVMDVVTQYVRHDNSLGAVTKGIFTDLERSFFASGSATGFGPVEVGNCIGAIWFLPAMFFAIVFFQIILHVTGDQEKWTGIACLLLALMGFVTARFIWFPFSIQAGMMATFFVWIGYEIKKRQILSKIRWYYYVLAFVVLVVGIVKGFCMVRIVAATMNDLILSLIVGLAGCLLIYLASIAYRGRVLAYFGRISLLILCVHLFALDTMGAYFSWILKKFGFEGNIASWVWIIMEVVFALLFAVIIDCAKKMFQGYHSRLLERVRAGENSGKDVTIDVVKGILMISMLIGCFCIDTGLRGIIFSCHMVALVFLSGYSYKTPDNIRTEFKRMAGRFLLPYAIFVVCVFLINYAQWNAGYCKTTLVQYLLGVSYTKNILTDVESVGLVYFLLLLFVVRCIYICIDKLIRSEPGRWIVVLLLSVTGVVLGNHGYWLPWSIDVALYCMIFYKLGIFFKDRGYLQCLKKNYVLYFLLTPMWAYMIYAGSMEIAVRNYGQYGVVILGALAGTLTVYIFGDYISNQMPILREILRNCGKAFLIILIVHTLLGTKISDFVALRFDPGYFTNMVLSVIIQLILAVLIYCIINGIIVKKRVQGSEQKMVS